MTKPRRRFAVQFGLLLAVLTAGCGGDVVLPGEGEAASIEIVDGDDQTAPVGTALPKQVVVKVLDGRGRPVTDQDVSFTVESGGGSVAPATVATDAEGQSAAAWTLGPAPGDHLLRARTPRGGSGTLEVSFGATATAGAGSNLVEVDGDEQTGPVNSALADSLVVRTTDALGNPVAGVEVTWTVAGGGSISPATVVSGSDGLAAAERVLGATAGAQSAQAAVPDFSGSPITFTHTAVPANPTALVLVSGDDQSAPAGFEVAGDLVVRLEDPDHNGIGNRAITWVVPAGSGSVDPVTVTTDANGLASTRWTLPNTVGPVSVSAVFSGLAPVVFSATATADVPTAIEMVSGNGQSAGVGAALTNPLVVRVTDASDNPVAGVSVAWTAVDGGTVNGEATANTATNSSGLAEVARVLGPTPQQYTTTAAVDGLQGSPITFVSTATVGPPAQLALAQAPGSPTVSGNAFSPAPIIQVQDAQGNPVPMGGIPVVVTISSGQPGAELENDQRNTNQNGRVTFSNLEISGPPAVDYVLTFTATFQGAPLTPVSSGLLVVTAGSATRLIITQQPSATVQSGVEFAQQPVVQVVDGTGNPVEGSRTIEVEIGDGGGTLEGTLTANTGGGSTATFTNLAISGSLGSRTLIFSSGALTPAESNPINVTTGPAETIGIQDGNNQTAAPGATLPTDPAVIIRDSGGNPVGGVEVTFTVTGGGGSASPSPVTTGSDGTAATNWTLGPAERDNTLTASSSVGDVTFNATAAVGTTTTLSADPDPPPAPSGTTVTFTATVTSSSGDLTGIVEFRDGGSPIGSDDVDNGGQAVLPIVLGDGPHSITAHYQGGGAFAPSESNPLSYEISAANTPPEVGADAFPVNEDAILIRPAPGVLANDDDADDDALTAQVVGMPTNGTVTLSSNGSFTYTPNPDYNGPDQFTYRANDGQANSAAATVSITVNAVNDDPSFTPGGDISVPILEALAFSDQWATGIDPGPPDESAQGVDFQVTLDNPADADAFQTPPQISDDGTLIFSALDLSLLEPRVIPLTVVLTDDGGGTSASVGITITITPLIGP